ncbi:hypothetical protein [Chryseobacterium sp. FH1]|uniref:hypothetical protein n=1 Tax=Chryseobacterium sp. FH1 TaxID=1233951 RepID=UPI0004E39FA2|nr:hypothetical protein [Chryseobacterium sp. FH1]KFC24442.1 hypothetical protein IO90_03875 [Chryseobacterium sp. FH1]
MKIFKYFFLFCIFLSLTSCFDIIDKISMKAHGSGEYTVILNASKSKTRLQSISKMETINGKKVPKKSEIESKVNQASNVFKSVAGISNVKTSLDFDNFIIKLSCNFKKIENINSGLEQLKAKNIIGKTVPTQLYKQNVAEKTFIRNKIESYKNDYDKLSKADKEVFSDATYTSILQFENVIKSQTNNSYTVSPNKKAIKLNGNILDFILRKKQIQNTISLN